jgi:hypothetical protein
MVSGKPTLSQILKLRQADDPVEVICYSGYRADESPREILIEGERFRVEEVIERRRERRGRRIYDVFFCRSEGLIVCLERPEGGSWKIKIKESQ